MHTPVTRGFSELLATTYALYLKTQNFHWNVTGSNFPMLHTFFQGQYEELADAVDLIAERIRALDHFAPASFQEFAALSLIKDSVDKKTAVEMLKELGADHRIMIALIQKLVPMTGKFADDASQDILIERLRSHQKILWMLNSF